MIRLASSLRVECERSPGVPLIDCRSVLLAAPLEMDERKAISAPTNSAVLVRGGRTSVEALDDSGLEAIETWLRIEGYKLAEVTSLGQEMARPQLVAERITFDPRARLDGVPEESPELIKLVETLRSRINRVEPNPKSETDDARLFARLRGRLAELAKQAQSFFTLFLSRREQGRSLGRRKTISADPPRRTLGERFSLGLRMLRWRVLARTRISRLIGEVHARYLSRMIEMFERGDLKEALRHAIPLGGEFESKVLKPALWRPSPRASLSLIPAATRARTAISIGDRVLDRLRDLYRSSFERLEAAGRIEEAAFVLAELLNAHEEAVAFLERHGRLRLAAEMAEARDLAPGLVVRQWFVAGDVQRAILIARKTGTFSDAVVRLERGDSRRGEQLRLLWAAALADQGDYGSAVEAIWPVASGRRLALDWLDRAIELGGPVGARSLARKLSIAPEEFEALRDRASELLESEDLEEASTRAAFAEALRRGTRTPQTKAVARIAVRAALRDSSVGAPAPMTNIQFRHLISFSGDGALKSDAPALSPPLDVRLSKRDQPLHHTVAENDNGSLLVSEAVYLPNGKTLVALGEAGVRLLNRDGKTVAHFDEPAERLVISDYADRAIAMVRRGEVWRLARIDLMSRRAEDWCEARVDAFAVDYDGSMWFVGARQDFYAIDASAKSFDALWRVPDVGDGTVLVARSQASCSFVTADWGPSEEWTYDLPSLRLRARNQVLLGGGMICLKSCLALGADGDLVDQSSYADLIDPESTGTEIHLMADKQLEMNASDCKLRFFREGVLQREMTVGSKSCVPGLPAISDAWIVSPVYEDGQCRVRLIDRDKFVTRLEVSLMKSEAVSIRLAHDWLTLADDRGRLLVFDLSSGQLIRNLRL